MNPQEVISHERQAYFVDEAAAVSASSRSKLYEAMRAGKLKAKKRGGRTIILRDDLAAYLAALPDYQPRAAA